VPAAKRILDPADPSALSSDTWGWAAFFSGVLVILRPLVSWRARSRVSVAQLEGESNRMCVALMIGD
jgi:hypothetical protein